MKRYGIKEERVNKSIIFATLILFALSGCSLRPDMPKVDTHYNYESEKSNISTQWWLDFKDEALTNLILKALKNNVDLKTAYINMQKANLSLANSNASWLPNVNADAKASKSGTTSSPINSFSVSASLNYELDLWGRVRDNIKAASANLKASNYDYEAAKLSITSSVAKGYFELKSLLAQKSVYEKSLHIYKEALKINQEKISAGAISESEYIQSKASVQSALLNLSNLNISISKSLNALAILTGSSNDEILKVDIKTGNTTTPQIRANITADILARRPDVAAAWQRIISQNALIGVARTAWLPSLSLTGAFGYASNELNSLFIPSSSSWSIGGSLLQMLFDGGKIKNNIELAKLNQDIAVLNYENTVRIALGDVKTALDSIHFATDILKGSIELVKSQERIYDLAKISYENGASEHLVLLDAQRGLLNAQLDEAKAKSSLNLAVVDLYKAFGGGFEIKD